MLRRDVSGVVRNFMSQKEEQPQLTKDSGKSSVRIDANIFITMNCIERRLKRL